MTTKDWLAVFVMASTGTFLGMVFIVVSPILPLVIEHFGGGTDGGSIAQWILTAPSIGVIIGGPTTGWFVERFGARAVLFTCLVLFALSGMAGLTIEGLPLLYATRLIVGFTATGLVTAAMGIIVEIFTEQQRGSILGLQNAIATVLSFLITLAAGRVAAHMGWRAPFALYGLSLPVLLLALAVIPAVSRRQMSPGGSLALFAPMLPIYALITISMIISFQSASQVPVLLAADGIASPATISEILAAGTLLFTVGAIAYGTLRNRAGIWWTFALALTLQGIGILGLSMGHGIVGIGVGVVLLNLGSGIQTPNLTHWVMDKAPLPVRGRAMGLLFSAQFLGPFLNTAVVARGIAAYVLRNMLVVIASLIGVGVILVVLRARSAPLVQGSH